MGLGSPIPRFQGRSNEGLKEVMGIQYGHVGSRGVLRFKGLQGSKSKGPSTQLSGFRYHETTLDSAFET